MVTTIKITCDGVFIQSTTAITASSSSSVVGRHSFNAVSSRHRCAANNNVGSEGQTKDNRSKFAYNVTTETEAYKSIASTVTSINSNSNNKNNKSLAGESGNVNGLNDLNDNKSVMVPRVSKATNIRKRYYFGNNHNNQSMCVTNGSSRWSNALLDTDIRTQSKEDATVNSGHQKYSSELLQLEPYQLSSIPALRERQNKEYVRWNNMYDGPQSLQNWTSGVVGSLTRSASSVTHQEFLNTVQRRNRQRLSQRRHLEMKVVHHRNSSHQLRNDLNLIDCNLSKRGNTCSINNGILFGMMAATTAHRQTTGITATDNNTKCHMSSASADALLMGDFPARTKKLLTTGITTTETGRVTSSTTAVYLGSSYYLNAMATTDALTTETETDRIHAIEEKNSRGSGGVSHGSRSFSMTDARFLNILKSACKLYRNTSGSARESRNVDKKSVYQQQQFNWNCHIGGSIASVRRRPKSPLNQPHSRTTYIFGQQYNDNKRQATSQQRNQQLMPKKSLFPAQELTYSAPNVSRWNPLTTTDWFG